MAKIPLVLFSGGLDSTAMLWKYLQTTPVDVLYADGGQHPLKIQKELECREKTIEYLNRVCPNKVQRDVRTDNVVIFAGGSTVKYSQPISWMVAALSVLDTNRHSTLAVGYVDDDGGFLRLLPNIVSAWENMQILSKTGDLVPLVFPIIDNSKLALLASIPVELLDSIWVCEFPTKHDTKGIVPCMKCKPCKLGRSVLRQYEEEFGYSIFSKKLVQQLRGAGKPTYSKWEPRNNFTRHPERIVAKYNTDSSDYYYSHPKPPKSEDELKETNTTNQLTSLLRNLTDA